jgi:hypothetical protein
MVDSVPVRLAVRFNIPQRGAAAKNKADDDLLRIDLMKG